MTKQFIQSTLSSTWEQHTAPTINNLVPMHTYHAAGMGTTVNRKPRIALLFTGQGAQYLHMGRELYETAPPFRAILHQCDSILSGYLGESLLSILYPPREESTAAINTLQNKDKTKTEEALVLPSPVRTPLDHTSYAQPALFALEYALATLWQSWGVGIPEQVPFLMGHSVGELVAACIAGVFTPEDGLKLVAARGRLMGTLPHGGAMAAVALNESNLRHFLAPYGGEVVIAAINATGNIVISGRQETVQRLIDHLIAEGINARILPVSHAFHSPLMEPMLDKFYQVAAGITYYPPQLPLISCMSGKLAGHEIMTPEYWMCHAREPVRFAAGMKTLAAQKIDAYLEIGPKATLLSMARQCLNAEIREREIQAKIIRDEQSSTFLAEEFFDLPLTVPSLREGASDWQQMVESLEDLARCGIEIDRQSLRQSHTQCPVYPVTAAASNGISNGEMPNHLAVPALHDTAQKTGDLSTYSTTEALLVSIWQEVLRVPTVTRDDDFFALRGDSLLATQIISRLRKASEVEGEVDLPLHTLLEKRTIRALSVEVDTLRQTKQQLGMPPPMPVNNALVLPLSFTQARVEGLVGMFVTAIDLRPQIADHATFRMVLQEVQATMHQAHIHQPLPLVLLMESLQLPANPSESNAW